MRCLFQRFEGAANDVMKYCKFFNYYPATRKCKLIYQLTNQKDEENIILTGDWETWLPSTWTPEKGHLAAGYIEGVTPDMKFKGKPLVFVNE